GSVRRRRRRRGPAAAAGGPPPTGVWPRRYAAGGTKRAPRRPYPEGMSTGPARAVRAGLAAGVTAPPAPRPRWLRRGRFDLVEIADALIAIIAFGLTNSALGNQNAQHGHHYSAPEILLVSFILCAPLLFRNRFPLSAWSASALAMILTNMLVPPHSLWTGAYSPAGVLVYGLCLYAVTVRCETWVVVGAGAVTVAGAVVINWPTSAAAVILTVVLILGGVIVRFRRSSREQLAVAERRHEGER